MCSCVYCGAMGFGVKLTVDHKIPFSKGGKTDDENLVTAGWECNIGQGAKLLWPCTSPAPPGAAQIPARASPNPLYDSINLSMIPYLSLVDRLHSMDMLYIRCSNMLATNKRS